MKTFTLILAVLMLVPAIPFASSLCESEYSCMTGKKDKNHQHTFEIMITSGRPRPTRPRMIVPTPITCIYDAQSESLNFVFSENLGGVTITIANTTTGTVIYDMCSTTPGNCKVMLPDEEANTRYYLKEITEKSTPEYSICNLR